MVSHVNSRGTLVPGCSTPIARVVLCTVTAGRVTYESVSVWKRTHCAPEQLATMGERGLSHMTSYMCTIMCGNGQSVRRLAKRPAPPNLMGQPRHCVDAVRRIRARRGPSARPLESSWPCSSAPHSIHQVCCGPCPSTSPPRIGCLDPVDETVQVLLQRGPRLLCEGK